MTLSHPDDPSGFNGHGLSFFFGMMVLFARGFGNPVELELLPPLPSIQPRNARTYFGQFGLALNSLHTSMYSGLLLITCSYVFPLWDPYENVGDGSSLDSMQSDSLSKSYHSVVKHGVSASDSIVSLGSFLAAI